MALSAKREVALTPSRFIIRLRWPLCHTAFATALPHHYPPEQQRLSILAHEPLVKAGRWGLARHYCADLTASAGESIAPFALAGDHHPQRVLIDERADLLAEILEADRFEHDVQAARLSGGGETFLIGE